MSKIEVDTSVAKYRKPLERDAKDLAKSLAADAQVVLLGSVASGKYVDVLWPAFGDRLVFPAMFAGLGDMSRGGLLLRCVRSMTELPYQPLRGAVRHGVRPPKLDATR